MANLTLGSLFDGSGGFPLAGIIAGIKPIWASEVEPFPIRVTKKNIPFMKHYGDVSKMDGGSVEPVDIITFGSPCQDMSIAGKRQGLEGSRSGLFYEAIRIIKEMRGASDGKYPRFIVWENVPGAFSSNKGEDFRCVLESICQVTDETISIPLPKKWQNAGCIMGDNYSVAWRVLDAQYWGVPQRRKRIFLVADFDGECAGKILFESEGLSGYSAESFRTWQNSATDSRESTSKPSISIDGYNGSISEKAAALRSNCGVSTGSSGVMVLNDQGGSRMDVSKDMTATLKAESNHPPLVFENHGQDSRYSGPLEKAYTVNSTYGTGGNNQPFVVDDSHKTFDVRFTSEGTRNARQNCYETEKVRTVDTKGNQPDANQGGLAIVEKTVYGISSKDSNSMKSSNPNSGFYEASKSRTLDINCGNPACNQGGMAVIEGNGTRPSHNGDGYKETEVMFTLNATEQHAVAYGIDRAAFNQGKNAKFDFAVTEEIEPTIVAKGPGAVAEPTYCTSKASYHTLAEEEKANTLVATDYKDPPLINDKKNQGLIVRRLTPTECARLQGFPDWWCQNLGVEHPTNEDVYEWHKIFETFRTTISGAKKPKTEKQIRAFLNNPHSDSAEYKMWGNGVALPCVYFVLSGIVWAAEKYTINS